MLISLMTISALNNCSNSETPSEYTDFACLGDRNLGLTLCSQTTPAKLITVISASDSLNFTLFLPTGLPDLAKIALEIAGSSVFSTDPTEGEICRYTFHPTSRAQPHVAKPLKAFIMFYDPLPAEQKTPFNDYMDVLGYTFPEGELPTNITFESVIIEDEAYFRIPQYDQRFRTSFCLWKMRKRGGFVRHQIALIAENGFETKLEFNDQYSVDGVNTSSINLPKAEPGILQNDKVPMFESESLKTAVVGKDYHQNRDGTWSYKRPVEEIKPVTAKPIKHPSSATKKPSKKPTPPKPDESSKPKRQPLILNAPKPLQLKDLLQEGPIIVLMIIIANVAIIGIAFCVGAEVIFEVFILEPVDTGESTKSKSKQASKEQEVSVSQSSAHGNALEAKSSSADFRVEDESQLQKEERSSIMAITSDMADPWA